MTAALPPGVAQAALPHQNDADHEVFHRIGTLTRQLHDALRELGYDASLQGALGRLPDARTRLDYIARLTGEAAGKVLDAVDGARLAQASADAGLERLEPAWAALAAGGPRAAAISPDLVSETAEHLARAREASVVVQARLTDIMMAQDFHDLTGQVIRRVGDLAVHLEEQLVKLLVASAPPERRAAEPEAGLAGPVMEGGGREVVTSQAQVDDLLAEMGF